MDPQASGVKTWQWVVTAIVIIVLIVIGVMVFGNKGSSSSSTSADDMSGMTGTSTSQSGALNRIVMSDQYPGNVVYLSSVQLANPGWVVIQSDNNGVPGTVIGTAYTPSGINPVKITLTSPMIDGGTYYATLYTGNNSASFDPNSEQPLTDSTGATIMHVFHASTSVGASLKG